MWLVESQWLSLMGVGENVKMVSPFPPPPHLIVVPPETWSIGPLVATSPGLEIPLDKPLKIPLPTHPTPRAPANPLGMSWPSGPSLLSASSFVY